MTVPRPDGGGDQPPQLVIANHVNDNVTSPPTSAPAPAPPPTNVNVNHVTHPISDATAPAQEAPQAVVTATASQEEESDPSQRTLKLWNEVAHGIDKNSTVVWNNAVNSLTDGLNFFLTSAEARAFVESYMRPVIGILLEQIPQKIGPMEKNCVQESLAKAVLIVLEDIEFRSDSDQDCVVLDVLSSIFNKKSQFYKGSKHSWNNHLGGMPEVRVHLIKKFRQLRGFAHLGKYLSTRVCTTRFPPLDIIRLFLEAAREAVPTDIAPSQQQQLSQQQQSQQQIIKKCYEEDIISVTQAVMQNLGNQPEDALKKLHHDDMTTLRWGLQAIYQPLLTTRRAETYRFYQFCRDFSLKLITSQSLPLKLYGWETVSELVEVSQSMAPPPKQYIASGAGVSFVNGTFTYAAHIGKDGFVPPKTDYSYEKMIPSTDPSKKAKKLTLFKCTMRSQQKWWFISEADEQQPGTDKDIDYYQQKSKKNEETYPPSTGWMTCKSAGVDPPPYLEPKGIVVPPGEEYNTMEHQLAKWAIENQIVERVLGNSLHREVVARSSRLICFLANMCTKDEAMEDDDLPEGGDKTLIPNAYCLSSSHLNLAWKTCASKLDAAVSAEIYQLLVSILPSIPNELAVELLNTIRKSCDDCLFEVAEFCSAYATSGEVDGTMYFSDEVRSVLLQLLWAVLTHPDASSLKCIGDVKAFMTRELKATSIGHDQRQTFLDSCKVTLKQNIEKKNCDEATAVRMVRLTRFILQACPQDQATHMIFSNDAELAMLLFDELIAYMKRREKHDSHSLTKKTSSTSANSEEFQHVPALVKRLEILRFVYGVSSTVEMTSEQLNTLWELCSEAEDREAVMYFIANAAHNESSTTTNSNHAMTDELSTAGLKALTAAYSEEVVVYAFQKIFCSESVGWEQLGPKAYQSFQALFRTSRKIAKVSLTSGGPALDALWRICLVAGDDKVASQAMRDLLTVYSHISESRRQNEVAAKNAWTKKNVIPIECDEKDSFAHKIFDCLQKVKLRLQRRESFSMRWAERCVRILNAAVGQNESSSALGSLGALSKMNSIQNIRDLVDIVPHGYRGQGCYKTISVVAKRTGVPHSSDSQIRRFPQTERFSIQIHPFETLASLKRKVSVACHHQLDLVRPITLDSKRNLNVESESVFLGDLNISEGSEIVFLLGTNPFPDNKGSHRKRSADRKNGLDLGEIFGGCGQGPSDEFFNVLLDVLESLALASHDSTVGTQKLVWDLLQSVPSNAGVVERVRNTAQIPLAQPSDDESEAMRVDIKRREDEWYRLLDSDHYQRSVYVLQVIDSFLQPAFEVVHREGSKELNSLLEKDATTFRQGFIESGGFEAVCRFFTRKKSYDSTDCSRFQIENMIILRILKACFYGKSAASSFAHGKAIPPAKLDNTGVVLMKSFKKVEPLLTNLTAAVVMDSRLPAVSVVDILLLVQSALIFDPTKVPTFAALPNGMSEKLTISLLKWDNKEDVNTSATASSARIRKSTEEFILQTPNLSQYALPWLIKALDNIDISTDCTSEFFSVIIRLVEQMNSEGVSSSSHLLKMLSDSVCKKLASYSDHGENSIDDGGANNGVLCGSLEIIATLIKCGERQTLVDGVSVLLRSFGSKPWSDSDKGTVDGDTMVMVNLMGIIFDIFLSDGATTSSTAICTDNDSRKLGFDVLNASAMACRNGEGYLSLALRVQNIISATAPSLAHRWGQQSVSLEDNGVTGGLANSSKYSGLRNQGCTCYMNSVLQQLFMMPELRKSLSSATLPSGLRSSYGATKSQGQDLVGKQISMQWECGRSYGADVLSFDQHTGTHIIRYHTLRLQNDNMNTSTEGDSSTHNASPLPQEFPDEFILSEGRPGKETGIFEISSPAASHLQVGITADTGDIDCPEIEETEDEKAYRCLLEEFQRTLVHLDQGSRGRVFDPKSLVEASACLKLEFDIWQQNDASEFAMKLLDKLEIPLKRWSPNEFKFLEHTFRLKQTKQKICKECGLKTNREENLMNIDCQIRGKSDIHEALSTMCEVEYMEGDNRVFCDSCKKNTDTVLRTAISALPDMLILSLKRFDLDYNTFETVKLNSRCEFGQTLNMKRYTLEGVEAAEKANGSEMEDSGVDPLSELPDDDYEYKLAGVLVHHGVAQGGHYYSFIRDRSDSGHDTNQWFRFDDEDVTAFDPSNIEAECFGGKVKKETKWPNGQVNTVETEQLCNALMLFYEKVKPTQFGNDGSDKDTVMDEPEHESANLDNMGLITGSDEYKDDVKRSNTVHRSHSFLFGKEFQSFIKGLLDVSVPNNTAETGSMIENNEISPPWKLAILNIALSFFFDILLHSIEKKDLDEWSTCLCKALKMSSNGSKMFLDELARRSRRVAGNWLRTFTSDCTEADSRFAAMDVISHAFLPVLAIPEEVESLKAWTTGWLEQTRDWEQLPKGVQSTSFPSVLQGKYHSLEKTSSIGSIISFLNSLLELAPRTWRYNSDLCFLLREMACIPTSLAGDVMRNALNAAQIPARLICLILREKSHPLLRAAFPGSSVSAEIVEASSKIESNPTSHLLPLSNISTSYVGPSTGSPSPADHLHAIEAIGATVGIIGAKSAVVLRETGEFSKARPVLDLTKAAKNALSTVFNECASHQGNLHAMTQKDILNYMKMCGTANISQQKIANVIAKYGKDSSYLTLEGFLAYYCDISQSSELQVLNDLHEFGFRPNLTRCSKEARFYRNGDQIVRYDKVECVVNDVMTMVKENNCIPPSRFTKIGLASLNLYHTASFSSCHLAEYLFALTVYLCRDDTNGLILEALRALYQVLGSWSGTDVAQVIQMILKTLAGIPDDKQKERITAIMQNTEKVDSRKDFGCGLLVVAKELCMSRASQHYSAEYSHDSVLLDTYIDAIRELRRLRAVDDWMAENKAQWSWLERWLRGETGRGSNRGDYNRRDGVINHSHNTYENHSDSDLNGDLNASDEEEDDDSRFDTYPQSNGGTLHVQGAGSVEVNGIYTCAGKFDSVDLYTKSGIWQGDEVTFTLFRCRLSDNTKRWYISIIPANNTPGTSKDIDFYMTNAHGGMTEIPHGYTWMTAKGHGLDPPPSVEWKQDIGLTSDDNDDPVEGDNMEETDQ